MKFKKLPTESLDVLFEQTINTEEYNKAQTDFNNSQIIFIIGNGGNLAVADHGAIDITRLSSKLAIAPGSGILATSIIGDSSIDVWFCNWLSAHIKVLGDEVIKKAMIIGVSSSGTAKNICDALLLGKESGMRTVMISSRKRLNHNNPYNTIEFNTDFYHTGEVLSLLMFYQFIEASGSECPSISKKLGEPSFDRLVNFTK